MRAEPRDVSTAIELPVMVAGETANLTCRRPANQPN